MAKKKSQIAANPSPAQNATDRLRFDTTAISVCGALLALVIGVFGLTLTFGSISLDDSLYGSSNPYLVQGFSASGFRYAFTAMPNYWQPGAFLSHLIDFQIFGQRLWGHHLMSVLLHCANTILLFLILRALSGRVWPSAWVAAIFAIHPQHVEAVAWIAARRDLLSAFFGLLAIVAYVRYQESPSAKRYSLIALLMFAAVATKPVLVVLPVLLLAFDLWPLRRDRSWWLLVLEKPPLFAIGGLFAVLALAAYQQGQGSAGGAAQVSRALPGSNAMGFLGFYLLKFFWPHPLSFDYPIFGHPHFQMLQTIGALVGVAGAFAAVYVRKQMPWILTGLIWWIACLAPTFGMGVADRFTYLPTIGICIALAWTIERFGKPAAVLGVASVLACATLSFRYTAYFSDSVPLYTHAIEVANADTQNSRMWLANVYLGRGNLPAAAQQFEELIRINPGNFAAHAQLAYLLLATGDTQQGLARLDRALQLRPDDPAARLLAARYLQDTGHISEAVAQYRIVLQLDPGNSTARAALDSLTLFKP